MTVLVSLDDVASWVGLTPSVILAYARMAGIPFKRDGESDTDTYYFEIDLDFVMQAGLPIDMELGFNQYLNLIRR